MIVPTRARNCCCRRHRLSEAAGPARAATADWRARPMGWRQAAHPRVPGLPDWRARPTDWPLAVAGRARSTGWPAPHCWAAPRPAAGPAAAERESPIDWPLVAVGRARSTGWLLVA